MPAHNYEKIKYKKLSELSAKERGKCDVVGCNKKAKHYDYDFAIKSIVRRCAAHR